MTATGLASGRPTDRRATTVRPEIQALRAAAVLGVVIFHLWPGRLTGGYVGVDVFFVISGFLITAHLMREVERTGTVRLREFWARRVRRLLPAGLLVLAASAVATVLWIPSTLWRQQFIEIFASTTYWQNFRLAADAVDYLGADAAPSVAQHYWSLSVEEQFYLVWPILLLLTLWATRGRGVPRRTVFAVALGVLGGTSLVWSIWFTVVDPAAAYFVTPTRVWEFAAGGLLALAVPDDEPGHRRWKILVQPLGWAAILAAFLFYTSGTPFPGYAALLPVLGTVAVIWAGSSSTTGSPISWASASKPVQAAGDVSYSLYLWHWPLIVVAPFVAGRPLALVGNLVLLAGAFILAFATKRWIEDPSRRAGWLTSSPWSSFGWAAGAMAAMSALTLGGVLYADRMLAASEEKTSELVARGTPCFGADLFLSSDDPCVNSELDGVLLPEPTSVKEDTGNAYSCYDQDPGADLLVCSEGSTLAGAPRIALVGNSHAASLLPGVRDQLDSTGWALDIYASRGCEWLTPVSLDDKCAPHQQALQSALVDGGYDLIIVSMRRLLDDDHAAAAVSAKRQADAWLPVIATGTRVAAVADNPLATDALLACVSEANGHADATNCSMEADEAWATPDPLIQAVELAGDGAHLIDLRDAYCRDGRCPGVIGHVIVYRDQSHITATFSRTLAPFLVSEVEDVRTSTDAG